jgi:uncharacterized protein (TIGR00251 family)
MLEVLKIGLYLLMGAVLISAIFSWVNPYAPMAGIFNALTNPLLRPFRRIIPPVGGVDLSPLALLLVLQDRALRPRRPAPGHPAGDVMNWLVADGDGVSLRLHVQPGAKKTEIAGLHGDALKIRLAAPPVDGKANACLIEFIARQLGVAKSAVELLSGETSRANACVASTESSCASNASARVIEALRDVAVATMARSVLRPSRAG